MTGTIHGRCIDLDRVTVNELNPESLTILHLHGVTPDDVSRAASGRRSVPILSSPYPLYVGQRIEFSGVLAVDPRRISELRYQHPAPGWLRGVHIEAVYV